MQPIHYRSIAVTVMLVAVALGTTILPVPSEAVTINIPQVPLPFIPALSLYESDFENDDGGWTASGTPGIWEWGTPISPPNLPPGSSKLWGTSLAGTNPPGTCAFVESPPIQIPAPDPGLGLEVAKFTFDAWYHTERGQDGALLYASTNGGSTWKILAADYDPVGLSLWVRPCLDTWGPSWSNHVWWQDPPMDPDAWDTKQVDLTHLMGEEVILRFGVAQSQSYSRPGFYFDNPRVEVGVGGQVTQLPFQSLTTIHASNFESDDGGWKSSGHANAWQWGSPAAPPVLPPGSSQVWGTRLAGAYPAGACGYLESPSISLPDLGSGLDPFGFSFARVVFDAWYEIEDLFDGAILQVSTNGGASWTVLDADYRQVIWDASTAACLGIPFNQLAWSSAYYPAPVPDEWRAYNADLTPFMGEDIVLRFAFASAPWTVTPRPGFYLNEIAVQVGIGYQIPEQVEF